MRNSLWGLIAVTAVATVGCKARTFNDSTVKDSWNRGADNAPSTFEIFGKLEYNFDVLKGKTKGILQNQPWSDTYWPNAEGGITSRWRFDAATSRFGYKSPYTPQEIENMTAEQINMLSPAEKFDLVSGGYRNGWPMWRREASLTTSCPAGVGTNVSQLPVRTLPGGMGRGDWEGKCHAWTPASLHFPEPGATDFEIKKSNGQKMVVHFGSSDIKALLIVGYDMFLNRYADYARAGNRCSKNYSKLGNGSSTPCLDTNAGTFFVLVTNMVQQGKSGFVIDVDPGEQVWNQPVYAYQHKITEGTCPITISRPAVKNGKVAYVETALAWVGELVPSEAPHGDRNRVEVTQYKYCVEIDENNNVVGGAWADKMRPDFIWMIGKPDFSAPVVDSRTNEKFDMNLLLKIYEKSREPQLSTQKSTDP